MVIAALSILGILAILWDAFEAIVLPRRVTRRFRLTKLWFRATWSPWRAVTRRIRANKRRERSLSYYGPLSLLFLFMAWAAGLIFCFAVLQWALGSGFNAPEGHVKFTTDLYMSATTFFTLGLGDVTPVTRAARIVTAAQGGTGFGFLALVISYLPVIYQAFSRRETNISLLDARAGSPSTAFELLRRHGLAHRLGDLPQYLHDWEHWAADLMESHLSYPVLGYYRSQHDNQSWLSALTVILDTCTLAIGGVDGLDKWQAELTFAMARHVVVDLAQVFSAAPRPPNPDRLTHQDMVKLRERLAEAGVVLHDGQAVDDKVAKLRSMYEPYANALSQFLLMPLPAWAPTAKALSNWQVTAWEAVAAADGALPGEEDQVPGSAHHGAGRRKKKETHETKA